MRSVLCSIIKDRVLLIAAVLALISMLIIPPSILCLRAINLSVLVIMFTLMLAVAGIYETNFFDYVATRLVRSCKSVKWMGLVVVVTTFWLGMLLTNDAVLLTLVPFTILLLKQTGQEKHAIMIIILQTIAANLGSALTPMGDPQNIYLYAYYNASFGKFLLITLPISIVGFVLVTTTAVLAIPHSHCQPQVVVPAINWKRFIIYALLIVNALLCVLRIVPPILTLALTLVVAVVVGRHLLHKVDYALLLTFVLFFIFTSNLSQMYVVQETIGQLLATRTSVLLAGLLTSQFISNVPAAILLASFTPDTYWPALLQGVNIGAMGTLIASLASLITFKMVVKSFPGQALAYLKSYSVLSIVFITIITCLTMLLPN